MNNVHFCETNETPRQSNSRLVDAAPELLGALKAVVAVHDSFAPLRRAHALARTGSENDPDPEYIARARQAIAKAVGR